MTDSRYYHVIRDIDPLLPRWLRSVLGAAAVGILPAAVGAQEVYTATLNSGLQNFPAWQSAIWSVSPGGGALVYPQNSPEALYNVIVPTAESIRLDDDVTISALTIDNGLTFQNGAAHKRLSVLGDFVLKAGTLVTMTAVDVTLGRTSFFTGQAILNNGSTLQNFGNLLSGIDSAGLHTVDDPTLSLAYDFYNAPNATALFARPGGVTFQNFKFLNEGSIEIQGTGTVNVGSSYTQTAGFTRIAPGAKLTSNSLTFSGGAIFAAGIDALHGGNFSLAGATVEIGAFQDEVSILTLSGNMSNSMRGTSLMFDLGGTVAESGYDQLGLPGGNFDGATLSVGFVNGFLDSIRNTDSFTLITGNNLSGTFANQVGSALTVTGVGDFIITRDSNSVVLTGFTPVPEPDAMTILAVSGALGFALRRRRL